MLSHSTIHLCQQTPKSLFLKALTCEIAARQFGSISSSAVAIVQHKNKNNSSCQQQRYYGNAVNKRCPVINGQAVPMHISDLLNYKQVNNSLSNNNNTTSTHQQQPHQQQQKRFESDLVVVLDMDECLIHSKFLNNPVAAQVYAHQLFQKRRASGSAAPTNSNWNTATKRHQQQQQKRLDSFTFTLPDGELVHVNLRPGLREFLQKVCTKYETHIFTAAVPIYADPLLDHLDPDRTLFSGRYYRDSCTFDEKYRVHVKNLENLPPLQKKPDCDRVVLVDNNPMSFLTHPNNSILVDSFYDDTNDTALNHVWSLLQALEDEPDVRPTLKNMFGLEQKFQQQQQQPQQQTQAQYAKL